MPGRKKVLVVLAGPETKVPQGVKKGIDPRVRPLIRGLDRWPNASRIGLVRPDAPIEANLELSQGRLLSRIIPDFFPVLGKLVL